MMRRTDPRIRQTINQISHNLESANETAQEGIYTFSHNYISPCLASVKSCVESCTAPCFPGREDQLRRRRRGRFGGRAELNFDFYDDWDYDEDATGDALLGWGNDELDRLLAGSGSSSGAGGGGAGRSSIEQQPGRRNRRMSYGARGGRRKSAVLAGDEGQDPTVIPSSPFLGFLERFPWRIGARGIRYRPSAADLQENPGGVRRSNLEESEPLIEGSEESDREDSKDGGRATPVTKVRSRSGTQSSHETSNSLSSRGDLIPSDEEGDAVPLDDEFTMTLGRRDTGSGFPDHPIASRSASGTSMKTTESSKNSKTSGKGKGKRRRNSRKTVSSKSPRSSASDGDMVETVHIPSMLDLKREEEQAQYEEELQIEQKRLAAQKLARTRGLSINKDDREPENEHDDDIPHEPEQQPEQLQEQPQQQPHDDSTHDISPTTLPANTSPSNPLSQMADTEDPLKPPDGHFHDDEPET